ncbi:MAG: prepilin-type N-terminal cleavage/methylation domain-containing protein [Candidatus Omnitrophota bacterium]
MKKQKGFTLIEILLVVVILAVLASMVLARFINQGENAYIAEAQQTLGVLRRCEANVLDQGLTLPALTSDDTQAGMPSLGLEGITPTNFTYTCEAGGTSCTASRVGSTSNTITLTLGGEYSCAGTYTLISATKGCRPKA